MRVIAMRATTAALLGLALTGCGDGPSEDDCADAEYFQAKFFEEDDPDWRAAYYANQMESEARCKEWRESQ